MSRIRAIKSGELRINIFLANIKVVFCLLNFYLAKIKAENI